MRGTKPLKISTMKKFLSTIDFALLRKQKQTLLKLKGETRQQDAHINGLLHLIDQIQDSAVDEYGYTEKEVFNFKD